MSDIFSCQQCDYSCDSQDLLTIHSNALHQCVDSKENIPQFDDAESPAYDTHTENWVACGNGKRQRLDISTVNRDESTCGVPTEDAGFEQDNQPSIQHVWSVADSYKNVSTVYRVSVPGSVLF